MEENLPKQLITEASINPLLADWRIFWDAAPSDFAIKAALGAVRAPRTRIFALPDDCSRLVPHGQHSPQYYVS
jgi:hypothetical protein